MSQRNILYLSRAHVEQAGVSMAEIIDALEFMFREKASGRVEMPPKPGIHPRPDSFLHAMPAYVERQNAAGIKWISAYPGNPEHGLPYITGLITLNDPETGLPLAVMDATWITAMRTGAASALAGKYLARPDASSVGIVACGVQGRSNLEAFCTLFPVERVHAYDIDEAVMHAYAEEMGERLGVEVRPVGAVAEAVRGMGIVITSGPILLDPDPAIPPGWLSPGAFACPLDFDSYWQADAFREADLLTTDDSAQFAYYQSGSGYFRDTPTPHAELSDVIAGKVAGRRAEGDRIIAIHLGLALEDMATARLVYDRARAAGIGVELDI
ncbi:MAG: ornithine cyclodeaminase family protein [Gammaproteobacteria bacterium]|nr:ornithine cyclodeaminase family protein [Gammaproteobacteria bacterium]